MRKQVIDTSKPIVCSICNKEKPFYVHIVTKRKTNLFICSSCFKSN